MWTSSASPSTTVPSTSRAVDSLSITPFGGATDSIRWAIPILSPGGVAPRTPGADLAGNHLTGVDADPQTQVDRVTSLDFVRQQCDLSLDAQRRQAGAWRGVLGT